MGRSFRYLLPLVLGLAASQCPAAAAAPVDVARPDAASTPAKIIADSSQNSSVADAAPAQSVPAAPQNAADKKVKKSRLRFRGKDGTCACDCASGGTSEAEIKKAQEAREQASR